MYRLWPGDADRAVLGERGEEWEEVKEEALSGVLPGEVRDEPGEEGEAFRRAWEVPGDGFGLKEDWGATGVAVCVWVRAGDSVGVSRRSHLGLGEGGSARGEESSALGSDL